MSFALWNPHGPVLDRDTRTIFLCALGIAWTIFFARWHTWAASGPIQRHAWTIFLHIMGHVDHFLRVLEHSWTSAGPIQRHAWTIFLYVLGHVDNFLRFLEHSWTCSGPIQRHASTMVSYVNNVYERRDLRGGWRYGAEPNTIRVVEPNNN